MAGVAAVDDHDEGITLPLEPRAASYWEYAASAPDCPKACALSVVLAHPLESSGAAAKIAVMSVFFQGSVFTATSMSVIKANDWFR